jgi:hypothetical protein
MPLPLFARGRHLASRTQRREKNMAKKNDTITPPAQVIEAVSPTSDVRIVLVERENSPERLVCEAELVFGSGLLSGITLVRFSLWKSPEGEPYVTFPSRAFGAGSERRFFDFLRRVEGDATPAKAVKQAIVSAYREWAASGI